MVSHLANQPEIHDAVKKRSGSRISPFTILTGILSWSYLGTAPGTISLPSSWPHYAIRCGFNSRKMGSISITNPAFLGSWINCCRPVLERSPWTESIDVRIAEIARTRENPFRGTLCFWCWTVTVTKHDWLPSEGESPEFSISASSWLTIVGSYKLWRLRSFFFLCHYFFFR